MHRDETVVTFGIGKALFALPVAPVVEILEARETAPLPRTPRHLLGLIDRRGISVPVVDLRRLLGQPDREDALDTRIIVLLIDTEGQTRRYIGLRVDRVLDVALLDDGGETQLAEAEMLRWNERMVAGIGKRQGKFVTVLDVDGLFDGELAELGTAAMVD